MFIILGFFSVIGSQTPYVNLAIISLIFISSTIRSFYEKDSIAAFTLQILLTSALCFHSNSLPTYIMFYECVHNKQYDKKHKIFLPSIAYFLFNVSTQKFDIPTVIINSLLVLGISTLILLLEKMIRRYITTKSQIAKAVSISAINELNQKKMNSELLMKNYLADKNARFEERENISRNIHNSVGHTITAAILTLDAADMLYDTQPERAREKMCAANEKIHGSLDAIRHAVRVLDADTTFVSVIDLIFMLKEVFNNFIIDTQIRIRDNFDNIKDNIMISHEHTEFLTGAVGEALSNGVRHGKADLFTVILTFDSNHLQISITDNGVSDFSIDNQNERIKNGFGLKKISSYLSKCGGKVEFVNVNGFKITMSLPLEKEQVNE